MDGLTEGRIVHHVDSDHVHRAAVVVHVWNKATGMVNVQVFNNGLYDIAHTVDGMFLRTSVAYSEQPVPYTWHWIEKA